MWRTMLCLFFSMFFLLACNQSTSAPNEAKPKVETPQVTQQPDTEAGKLKGIDVSHYDGKVDWHKIRKEGYHFAIAKGTQGVDYVDPTFVDNFKAMKEAGLLRGAYHFYMTNDDPHEQAENVFSNIVLDHHDIPIVIDIETYHSHTPDDWRTAFRVFVDALEAHYGVKPIIYTSPNFWDQKMAQDYSDYPLWIAQYDVEEPRVPAHWNDWHFWQYSAKIDTGAAEDFVDGNHFNGNFESLKQFLVKDRTRPGD